MHLLGAAKLGLLTAVILLCLQAPEVSGKGGRGGSSSRGSSGRYSSGRYSSGSRSSSRSSSRYSRSRGSTSYSRMSTFVASAFVWRVKYRGVRSGYYLSSRIWRRHYSGNEDMEEDDTGFCFNYKDSVPSAYNDSVQTPWYYKNRTVYGLFVCPMDSNEERIYCCGDDGEEYCCSFWEDTGKVVGVSVGIAFGAAGIVLLIYILVNCCKGAKTSKVTVSSTELTTSTQKPAEHSDLPPSYTNLYGAEFSDQKHPPPPDVVQPGAAEGYSDGAEAGTAANSRADE